MRYIDRLLAEFDHEVAKTREVLVLVPDELLDWQAKDGMHTIGWNANHLAEIVDWIWGALALDTWDIKPADGPAYDSPKLESVSQIVELFDTNVERAHEAFATAGDSKIDDAWTLAQGGTPLFTMPRSQVLRNFGLSHLVHHRAVLRTYLRLNDVELPETYGAG